VGGDRDADVHLSATYLKEWPLRDPIGDDRELTRSPGLSVVHGSGKF